MYSHGIEKNSRKCQKSFVPQTNGDNYMVHVIGTILMHFLRLLSCQCRNLKTVPNKMKAPYPWLCASVGFSEFRLNLLQKSYTFQVGKNVFSVARLIKEAFSCPRTTWLNNLLSSIGTLVSLNSETNMKIIFSSAHLKNLVNWLNQMLKG